MSELRADAARNHAAILRVADDLLQAASAPADVSMEAVASAAGVAKGTLFRRFGDREGLISAVVAERMRPLKEAIESGPPPLGPDAPPAERILLGRLGVGFDLARHRLVVTAFGFGMHIVEEKLDRNLQYARHLEQAAGADAVGPAFVFLDLLEVQPDRAAELLLAHAHQRAAQADPGADVNVDGAGGIDLRPPAASFHIACRGLHPNHPKNFEYS